MITFFVAFLFFFLVKTEGFPVTISPGIYPISLRNLRIWKNCKKFHFLITFWVIFYRRLISKDHVTKFKLYWRRQIQGCMLVGPIPSSISKLTNLKDLYVMDIHGLSCCFINFVLCSVIFLEYVFWWQSGGSVTWEEMGQLSQSWVIWNPWRHCELISLL